MLLTKKLSILAVFAALALAPAMPTFAQVQIDPGHVDTRPTTEPTCQADCDGDDGHDESSIVGEPWYPPVPDPDCQTDCGPGGSGTGSSGSSSGVGVADSCGGKLGLLRPVAPAQIESVGSDALVDVVPVCRRKGLAAQQEQVASLRDDIARNAILDGELGQQGYTPDHVVGVIVNGPAVTLYVHGR